MVYRQNCNTDTAITFTDLAGGIIGLCIVSASKFSIVISTAYRSRINQTISGTDKIILNIRDTKQNEF